MLLFPGKSFFLQVWPDSAPRAVAASCSADSLVPLIPSEADLDGIAAVAGNGSKVYAYCLGSHPTSFHMFSPTLVGQLTASCRLVWGHKPFWSLLHTLVVPNMEWALSQASEALPSLRVRNSGVRRLVMSPAVQVNYPSSMVHLKKGGLSRWCIKHNVLCMLCKEQKS